MSAAETGGATNAALTPTTMANSFTGPAIQISQAKPVLQASFPFAPVAASSPTYQPGVVVDGVAGRSANLTASAAGDQMKRRRGRPRKYNPDGSIATTPLTTPPQHVSMTTPPGGNFSQSAPPPPPTPHSAAGPPAPGRQASPSSSPMKKPRGRPPGSSRKQPGVEDLGSIGIGFKPHVLAVRAGEDVSAKIMSFSQNGSRAICILSANGAISNVTLRQAATSGGTATYEVDGQRSRTGGLSVTLAGPDGRVLGGCVAGLLIAATPVQVVIGSFMADERKESKSTNRVEPQAYPGAGGSSSPSRGTLSESSGGGGGGGGPASPFHRASGASVNHQMMSLEWN